MSNLPIKHKIGLRSGKNTGMFSSNNMTQIAGSDCSLCNEKILIDKSGTYCYRCETVLCVDCAEPGTICNGCNKTWDDPTEYYAYSELCHGCMRDSNRTETCPFCGTQTRWDNQEAFDEFMNQHRDWVAKTPMVALAYIGSGAVLVVLILTLLLSLFGGGLIGWVILFFMAAGAVKLISDGIIRLQRCKRRRGFY